MLSLSKFTFGVGDRFSHQASAQLQAFKLLESQGILVVPVWNKSNREHNFVGSEPASVLVAAEQAVSECDWNHPWHIDADHIQLETVGRFLACSDFFTIDVADSIGQSVSPEEIASFIERHPELVGTVVVPGIEDSLELSSAFIAKVASKYLAAANKAGEIYRHIASERGDKPFAVEVSMDETDSAQTPKELLIILAALADQKIPLQTIAPKFTGRFNKGVDYVGDPVQFEREFRDDIQILKFAARIYGLPTGLKLSVHSGSDKFTLYPIIHRVLEDTQAGIHVKTAGTTWLEEVIGLAESGGEGLQLVKEMYLYAREHVEELCKPYASVIDIHPDRLPGASEVNEWSGSRFASAIRHIPANPEFNSDMRQLLHVSFKLAAKAGARYTDLLVANRKIVAEQVTTNLFERHLKPIFLG